MMAYKEALMKLSHEPWLPFAKTLGTLSLSGKSMATRESI